MWDLRFGWARVHMTGLVSLDVLYCVEWRLILLRCAVLACCYLVGFNMVVWGWSAAKLGNR